MRQLKEAGGKNHIVELQDVLVSEPKGNTLFLVMEFIPMTLRDFVNQLSSKSFSQD